MKLRDNYGPTLLGGALIFVAILVGMVFAITTVKSHQCATKARGIGLDYEFNFLGGGCFVEVGDSLVHIDMIRINDEGEVLPSDSGG